VPKDEWPRLDRGEELPLAGKHLFRLPFGEFYSANLTPDAATGIGRRSDVGPRFGGGQRMDVAADPKMVFVPPNLTPDPETSPIGMWSEDDFVGRMRGGERILGTLMPWGAYGRMTDDDLRSVYRYLRSLPPYRHETGPRIQPR
jgi:hypothetical protein